MNVKQAAELAIKHACWDAQDPHVCVEPTMEYHQCEMTVHIRHRGIMLMVTIIVEPVMSSVLERELEGLRPGYIFARAMRVQSPEHVDEFLTELRQSGIEFVLF